MTKIEVLKDNRYVIAEAMQYAFTDIMRSANRGGMEVKIYIWEDGEIERLTTVSGSNDWLKPRDNEDRALYYVTTVKGEWCEDEDVEDIIADYDPEWLLDGIIDSAEETEWLLDVVIDSVEEDEQ